MAGWASVVDRCNMTSVTKYSGASACMSPLWVVCELENENNCELQKCDFLILFFYLFCILNELLLAYYPRQ